MPQPQFFLDDGTPISDDSIVDAFSAGQLRAQAGDSVVMRTNAGEIRNVPAEQLAEARRLGFVPLTGSQTAELERQEQYGTVGQQAVTALEAGARGATFGASDAVLAATLGEDWRQGAQARQEVNPTVSTVGEIGGAVAPVLLSGGTGALGAAARLTPAAVAARGGMAIERAAGAGARALGLAGQGTASRAALRAIELGSAAAFEGAAYGAGQAVSRAAIEGTEITAEKLLSGGLEGAKWGALGGAALGGAGTVAAAAGRRAVSAAESVAGRLPSVAQIGERKTLQAVGLSGDDIERMIATHGEDRVAAVANRLHDEGLIKITDSAAQRATKLTRAVDDANETLSKIRKQADSQNVPAPGYTEVTDAIRAQVQASAGDLPAMAQRRLRSVEREVVSEITARAKTGAPPTYDFWAQVQSKALGKSSEKATHFASAAAAIDEKLTTSLASASEDVGKNYLAAKSRFSDLVTVARAANSQAGRKLTPSLLSMSDNLLGSTAATGAIVSAIASGSVSPISAFASGTVTGAAVSAASALIRERSDAIIANTARALQKFNDRKGAAVKSLLSSDAVKRQSRRVAHALPFAVVAAEDAEERFRDQSPSGRDFARVYSQIESYALSPPTYAKQVADAVAGLSQTNPALAQAVVQQALMDGEYLNTKLPPVMTRANYSPTPHLEKPEVSKTEQAKLMRISEALVDPLSVVEDLASGDVSLEAVEALKIRRPRVFDEIRTDIMRELSMREEPLPFTKRYVLGLAFDFVSDRALDPTYSVTIQQTYQAESERFESESGAPPPTSTQMETLSSSSLTPTQRMALGE